MKPRSTTVPLSCPFVRMVLFRVKVTAILLMVAGSGRPPCFSLPTFRRYLGRGVQQGKIGSKEGGGVVIATSK
jgi:hypothetical protein